MTMKSRTLLSASISLISWMSLGCSAPDDDLTQTEASTDDQATGGQTAGDGADDPFAGRTETGGATSAESGGAPATGGSISTGGASSTGGADGPSGGASSTGGASGGPICTDEVCCGATCGECGGDGCGSRSGGGSECCSGPILSSGVYCEGKSGENAPCILGSKPDPDPDPDPDPGNTDELGVCIEMESISPAGKWREQKTKPGYSGSGYFNWTGDTQFKENEISKHILVYQFDIPKAGTYRLGFRGRRDKEGVCMGAADDRCNDIWTKMDAKAWRKTMVRKPWGTWAWDARYECASHTLCDHDIELSKGKHTLRVEGRSLGTKLDAFRLYPAGEGAPDRCN